MFRYYFIRFFMRLIQHILLLSITVFGKENIPGKGPYIVVLNHTSVVDTPVLMLAFPPMKWSFFAVDKWRTHPIYGPIMGWLGAIYVKRGEVDRATLRQAMNAIKDGMVFGLAPEGTRSATGSLLEARDGAAYLASRANVPILPVGIVNNDRLFTNFKKFRRTRAEIHIGEPFMLPELGRRAKGADLTAYTHLIMAKIAAQLPESYHGVYAASPAVAALQRGEEAWPYCYEPLLTQS